jgi:tetratricopeptide (TPR) repeat protein
LDEAENRFMEALRKQPGLVEANFNLGCLFQEKREFEKALSFFKTVVSLKPHDVGTWLKMGSCAKSLGRSEDAIVFYKEAFRRKPNSLEAGAALSGLYLETGDANQAVEVILVSLVSHPDNVPLHLTLGLLLKDQEKFESALGQFNKVVQLDPEHALGFYHLGLCCMALGFVDQAEPFFAKAYKLDTSLTEAVLELGQLYEKKNDPDSAAMMYKQWIDATENRLWQLGPEIQSVFKDVCEKTALYLENSGNFTEAQTFRAKLGELEPPQTETAAPADYRVTLTIDD